MTDTSDFSQNGDGLPWDASRLSIEFIPTGDGTPLAIGVFRGKRLVVRFTLSELERINAELAAFKRPLPRQPQEDELRDKQQHHGPRHQE